MNRVEAAQNYLRRGWYSIPIEPQQKAPKQNGWQNWRINYPDIGRCFRGAGNLGVLLGEPSNWLIDVDLDHPLAVELASEFLPATAAIFGRKSKQRSHWLYTISEPAPTKREQAIIETKKAMLVEFRSSGCQTVFPPSVHPSGERIEWASYGEPPTLDPNVLLSAVSKLATEVRKRLGVQDVAPELKPRRVPIGPMRTASTSDVERCRRYVAKLPLAISGALGHHAAFRAACEIYRFGLEDGDAWSLLQEFNNRCVPPFSERELEHKLRDARQRVESSGEFGSRLRVQTEAWRLQKPGEPVAIWKARVHAIEHRLKQGRRQPA